MWAESKMKRLEQLKENNVDKDIKDCTFRPNVQGFQALQTSKRQGSVDSSRNEVSQVKNIRSVERYVNRMNNARTQKVEILNELNSQIGSGKVWQNKSTVPKEPKLATTIRNQKLELANLSMAGLTKSENTQSQKTLNTLITQFE